MIFIKKYKLTKEYICCSDDLAQINIDHLNNSTDTLKLYRIRALRDFGSVRKGDLGGFIESEDNLSHEGTCWVSEDAVVRDNAVVWDNAKVCGSARVTDNAVVYDNAVVSGSARVTDNARVSGSVMVTDSARVCGSVRVTNNAVVSDNAEVCGNAIVSDNAKVCGNAVVCGNDFITGITIVKSNACEFNITASFKDAYIRVGCQSHSIDFWKNYIKTNSKEFVSQCINSISHKQCCFEIQALILNYDLEKQL